MIQPIKFISKDSWYWNTSDQSKSHESAYYELAYYVCLLAGVASKHKIL